MARPAFRRRWRFVSRRPSEAHPKHGSGCRPPAIWRKRSSMKSRFGWSATRLRQRRKFSGITSRTHRKPQLSFRSTGWYPLRTEARTTVGLTTMRAPFMGPNVPSANAHGQRGLGMISEFNSFLQSWGVRNHGGSSVCNTIVRRRGGVRFTDHERRWSVPPLAPAMPGDGLPEGAPILYQVLRRLCAAQDDAIEALLQDETRVCGEAALMPTGWPVYRFGTSEFDSCLITKGPIKSV